MIVTGDYIKDENGNDIDFHRLKGYEGKRIKVKGFLENPTNAQTLSEVSGVLKKYLGTKDLDANTSCHRLEFDNGAIINVCFNVDRKIIN